MSTMFGPGSPIGPQGMSWFIPTGAAPNWEDLLRDDPFYKQDITNLTLAEQRAQQQLAQDKTFAEQMFGINQQQAQQGVANQIASGQVAIGNAQSQADLQRAQAAANNARQAEFLRELMASRGLGSSGQRALEANELAQDYGFQVQGINQGLQAVQNTIGQENANAQASLTLQLQQLLAQNQNALFGFNQQALTIPEQFAAERGQAAFTTYQRLLASGRLDQPGVNAIWDQESGLYVTANGEYYGVGADGSPYKTNWNRPAPAAPAAPAAAIPPGATPDYGELTGGGAGPASAPWELPPPYEPPGGPPEPYIPYWPNYAI